MNYRALEDLVNILIKKTGYKLSDVKLEEDIDFLEERKKDIEKEFTKVKDDESSKGKYLNKSLGEELDVINDSIEEKNADSINLGNKILDAYRNNESFDKISDTLEQLVKKARNEYEKTHEEVKQSNIFELIDEYSNKKKNYITSLEEKDYFNSENKELMTLRINYHSDKIEELKRELEIIDKKKEKLMSLQNDADNVSKRVHKEIEQKDNLLSTYLEELYYESNLIADEDSYKKIIDSIRKEIADLSYLESKYNDDIKSYKMKIKELDSKIIEVNERINIEEKTMMITQDLLDNKENDLLDKLSDSIELLKSSNRVENLINEQQYLYVNVDVIKEEIINLWNKESSSNKKVKDLKEETKIEDKKPEKSKAEVIEKPVDNEKTTEVEDTDDYFDFDDDNNLEVIDYLD